MFKYRRNPVVFRHEQLEKRTMLTGVSFSSAIPISPEISPPVGAPLAIVDFDNDGDNDIATIEVYRLDTLSPLENRVRWLVNNDGEFQFGTNDIHFYTNTTPAFADVDGDGDQDLYYLERHDSDDLRYVYWLENNGGVFAPAARLANGIDRNLVLADLNGSGLVELIGVDDSEMSITLFDIVDGRHRQQATISLETAGTRFFTPRIEDADGDGDNDIIVRFDRSFTQPFSMILLENRGNFEFVPIELTSAERISDFADFADFDGDGDIDGLASTESKLFWLENNSEGDWIQHLIFEAKPDENGEIHELGAGSVVDFDLDGDMDIAVYLGYGGYNIVRNDGGGQFVKTELTVTDFELGRSVLRGDADGDGDVDEVTAQRDGPALFLKKNLGGQAFETISLLAPPEPFEATRFRPSTLSVQDLDGDSDPDVLFQDGHGFYENLENGRFSTGLRSLFATRGNLVDLDGDGLVDRVVAPFNSGGRTTRHIFDWSKNENGTFDSVRRVTLDDSIPAIPRGLFLRITDVDGDGDADAWLTGFRAGDRWSLVLYNDGQGNFLDPTFFERDEEPPAVGEMIDFNGDGRLDLLSFHNVANRGQIHLYPNLGNGEFGERIQVTDRVQSFEVADVNGDGLQDIVVTKRPEADVVLEWYLNSENGFFRAAQLDVGEFTSLSFHLADLDDDGRWEVITANADQGLVYYELNLDTIDSGIIDGDLKSLPYGVDSADLNGDGRLDLTIATATAVHWYENLGTMEDRQTRIDSLSQAIREKSTDAAFDLDGNKVVDQFDRDYLIETILKTAHGDADLDGTVSLDDFLVFSSNFGKSGTWKDGDFDGDGFIDFEDFLLLADNFAGQQAG